tara:strand:- start:1 stop:243 length:243 start_codon:yes stop_codon:yes gene_type:complete
LNAAQKDNADVIGAPQLSGEENSESFGYLSQPVDTIHQAGPLYNSGEIALDTANAPTRTVTHRGPRVRRKRQHESVSAIR